MSEDLTPRESQRARALLNWSQVRLASRCGLSEATVRDFESRKRILRVEKVLSIRQAFEAAGVVFTPAGPSQTNLSEGEAGVIGSNGM